MGLEVADFWGAVHSYRDQITRSWKPLTKDGAKMISITAGDLYDKSNYQDFAAVSGAGHRHRRGCGSDAAVR